jgi:hypothetical protein
MTDPMILIVVLVVVVAAAVGGFLFWRGRAPKDEGFYHFRCPSCRRRLRYQARQVGHKGKCSNCGKDVTFPHTSQSID